MGQRLFWVLFETQGIFAGFDFWPHAIEILRPNPLGSTLFLLIIAVVTLLSAKITILVSAPKVVTNS